MRAGRLLSATPALEAIREHARAELARLPEPLRSLDDAVPCPVEIAPPLRTLAAEIDTRT
jgi:nicotinate phosphoribosyltransferase